MPDNANPCSRRDSDDVFAVFMNAFTHALDPHSTYFSPNNFEEYRIQMSRAYYGVGASLTMEDDHVLVREVLSGGPAEEDGRLRAGDRITGVDGSASGELIDVVGWRLDNVVELIRGPADTPVVLRILPGGEAAGSESLLLELTRGRVRLEGAEKELLTTQRNGENVNVGVIRIANFYFDMEGRKAGLKDYPSSTRDVKAPYRRAQIRGRGEPDPRLAAQRRRPFERGDIAGRAVCWRGTRRPGARTRSAAASVQEPRASARMGRPLGGAC